MWSCCERIWRCVRFHAVLYGLSYGCLWRCNSAWPGGSSAVMKVPLVSIAQVWILAEGAFQPLPGCGTLPERLRFGLRDLRFCT